MNGLYGSNLILNSRWIKSTETQSIPLFCNLLVLHFLWLYPWISLKAAAQAFKWPEHVNDAVQRTHMTALCTDDMSDLYVRKWFHFIQADLVELSPWGWIGRHTWHSPFGLAILLHCWDILCSEGDKHLHTHSDTHRTAHKVFNPTTQPRVALSFANEIPSFICVHVIFHWMTAEEAWHGPFLFICV